MALFAGIGLFYLVQRRASLFGGVRIAYAAPPHDWLLGLLASAVLAISTGGVYRECLRTAGVDVPLARATRLALASHFFNCAVPGGKLSSIVLFTAEADRRTDSPGRGAAGFFTASLIGRVCLTVVALVTLPFTARVGMAPLIVVLLFALYTAITVVRVGVFALLHRRHDRLLRWEMRARSRMRRRTTAVRDDRSATWTACVADQWAQRSRFLPAVAWSLVGKLAGAALVTVGVQAAGGSIPIATALSLYALATVAGSLALVPVGLGVVELTMMHSLTGSGLTIAQAAAALDDLPALPIVVADDGGPRRPHRVAPCHAGEAHTTGRERDRSRGRRRGDNYTDGCVTDPLEHWCDHRWRWVHGPSDPMVAFAIRR